MNYEYATTSTYLYRGMGEGYDDEENEPPAPLGDGWECVAMAANETRLFWTWRKAQPDGGDKEESADGK